jgi:hypothetical protein
VIKVDPKILSYLGWVFCGILFISGLVIGVKAIFNFTQAVIIIDWATASEFETVGFNILRSESENGPFEQINDRVISPSDDPLTGGEYSFQDKDAIRGRTYYYLLEEIENSGNKNQHGPIIQTATNSSILNLLLAAALITSSALYIWLLLNPPSNQNSDNSPT